MKDVYNNYLKVYQRIISILEEEIYPRVREAIHVYSDKGHLRFNSENVWKEIRGEAENLIYWGEIIRYRLLEDIINIIRDRYEIISIKQLEGKWVMGEYVKGRIKVYDQYRRVDRYLDSLDYKKRMGNKVVVNNPVIITVLDENERGERRRYELLLTSRIKSVNSILQKLKLSTFTDKELSDIVGLRIIVRGENESQKTRKETIDTVRRLAKDILNRYIENEQKECKNALIVPYLIKGIPVRIRYKEHLKGKLYSQRVRVKDHLDIVIYYISRNKYYNSKNQKNNKNKKNNESDLFINWIIKRNTYKDREGKEKKKFKRVILRKGSKEIETYELDDNYLGSIESNYNTKSLWFIPMNFEHALDEDKTYYIVIRTTDKNNIEEERRVTLVKYLEKRKMVENYGQMSRNRQLPHPVLLPVDRPFKDVKVMSIQSNTNLYEEINGLISEVIGIRNYGPEELEVFIKDRYKGEVKAEGTGSDYKAVHISLSIKSRENKIPCMQIQLLDVDSHVNNEAGSASHEKYKLSKGKLIIKILRDIMEGIGINNGRQGNILKEIDNILDL